MYLCVTSCFFFFFSLYPFILIVLLFSFIPIYQYSLSLEWISWSSIRVFSSLQTHVETFHRKLGLFTAKIDVTKLCVTVYLSIHSICGHLIKDKEWGPNTMGPTMLSEKISLWQNYGYKHVENLYTFLCLITLIVIVSPCLYLSQKDWCSCAFVIFKGVKILNLSI